ncbi:protein FAM161A [Plodia interpunctella]|uniref:protein FAM161A n=1 Tax=Plodia interpunctella TaxID=58824 RepID=UPI002368A81E|nr:protein FAM161A [Plodia interpunctella]
MSHRCSVFKNLCLKVPVDPINKMPKTAYERKDKPSNDPSLDSPSTVGSITAPDVDAEKLKDFYRSIPDYNDINHLTEEEFYLTLKSLRERKRVMLGIAVEHIDSNGLPDKSIAIDTTFAKIDAGTPCRDKITKSKLNYKLRNKYSEEKRDVEKPTYDIDKANNTLVCTNKIKMKRCPRKSFSKDKDSNGIDELKVTPVKTSLLKDKNKLERPRRNHSACSISWNDAKLEGKDEIDEKFEQYFDGKKYSPTCTEMDEEFKTRSMPSSPLRMRRNVSPSRGRKIVTIPKPFKMTERDEEDRIVSELRSLRKSFSEDMLDQKYKRKQFKARPVPIESRIPLYDKILEDQAMRRAITKINSEADLRAQMKPFSFTKREEKGGAVCERAVHALPKSKKKKRFKARPVPKNLFSNYFYDKIKEDEFFRSMNRRIRAEELLRASTYPGTMAARERSRLSTPAAHSDLPIDPSPAVPSIASTERPNSPTKNRHRSSSPTKCQKKRDKFMKEDLLTTSPQPFRFNTADRAAKKMLDITKKIYQDSKCTESGSGNGAPGSRAYSALDLRAAASGRSNLAALLRAEAVRRRFEVESARRLADQRRRMEMKQRDRLLRSKPAWHLVKNNHEEDIAMRLQTRRDEERMRREEFLHEMELMYGRVHDQPMLFERYYAPRPYAVPVDSIQISPRKSPKKRSSCKSHHYTSPIRSRKVSINDTAETFNGDLSEYLNKIDDDKLFSDSEVAIDSLDGAKL